jgi:predicted PurR-regulated permease PerM
VGPLIGAFFGMLVGLIVYLQAPVDMSFLSFMLAIALIYVIVQTTDNIVFQPLIFSNSVKAHPLEIFIVILGAGYLAGIVGMFLAIPVYTILRVLAREFFYNYRVVQKITGRL